MKDDDIPVARLKSGFLRAGLTRFKHGFWVPFMVLAIAALLAHGVIGLNSTCRPDRDTVMAIMVNTKTFAKLHGVEDDKMVCSFSEGAHGMNSCGSSFERKHDSAMCYGKTSNGYIVNVRCTEFECDEVK